MALSGGRTRSPRLLIVTLVCASLVTITVDYREGDGGPLAAAGRATISAIAPLQEAVSEITHPIGSFFSTLVRLPSIRRDDAELRARIAELEAQQATYLALLDRVEQAEDLLDVRRTLGEDAETIGAEVIANGVSNLEWSIEIDKGSDAQIRLNDPVIVGDATGARLVGHVAKVTGNASIVQLIVDPESHVAVRLPEAGVTGLLSGQGSQDMRIELIEEVVPVEATDAVVTASFSIQGVGESRYPPGILVGSVSRAVPTDAALEKFITVRPAVDFSSLDLVLVVLSDGSG
ncbi:MAG TPA: rod shape-determining protein MreC [Actinomycetota bacterium]|nr:rod shape-determining protein MreC [Actinomycetota bacterium]